MERTIKVSEETYEKIKDQISEPPKSIKTKKDMIGNKYFFRTVTYHLVGRVVGLSSTWFLQLEDASWVADSGRFMDAIKLGSLKEVEPVGTAFINLSSVTDFFPWKHQLPRKQK